MAKTNMRIGVCTEPENLAMIQQAGAAYIECAAARLGQYTDDQIREFAEELAFQRLRCEALAVLFPGADIPLTGPDADLARIESYVRGVFERVHLLRPSVVVFGSGGARRIPDGFNHDAALAQLVETSRVIASAADAYGITVALEPLNRSETNCINTLSEAAVVARQVSHPRFKLIADLYHMQMENEPASVLLDCGELIAHTHVAAKEGRLCPQQQDRDALQPYFDALKAIGYNGRMSIEARIDNFALLASSITLLHELAA